MKRDSLLQVLPPTRRDIITFLKTSGDASVDDLARALSMTASAIRQHIVPLEAEGLVDHVEVGTGPGRRKRRYRLTERGNALFPDHCGSLAETCVAALEQSDPATLQRLLAEGLRIEYRAFTRDLALLPASALEERLKLLVAMFEQHDFMPVTERGADGDQLVFQHCPYLGLARSSGAICRAELDVIREALPVASVERVEHRIDGDRFCAFRISGARVPRLD